MITLKNLSAEPNGETPAPRGILPGLHHEAQPGIWQNFHFTRDGLVCHLNGKGVFIPLSELALLVEKHAPGFIPPAKPARP